MSFAVMRLKFIDPIVYDDLIQIYSAIALLNRFSFEVRHWLVKAGNLADVVVAGHDRAEPALLSIPSLQGCQSIAPDLAGCSFSDLAFHPRVRAVVLDMLHKLALDRDGAAQSDMSFPRPGRLSPPLCKPPYQNGRSHLRHRGASHMAGRESILPPSGANLRK